MPEEGPDFSLLAAPRQLSVGAHIDRSRFWSGHVSELGQTAMIYGAIELRLGIESGLIQMLMQVGGDNLDASDLKALRSAKSIQTRIHQLEGHQGVLDRKLEFLSLLMEMAGAPAFPLARLQVGKAFGHWQALSELCHFAWPWTDETKEEAIKLLADAESFLDPIGRSMIVWPTYHDRLVMSLEKEFVDGAIDIQKARQALEEHGAWGLVTQPDGTKQFASEVWGK